MAQNIPSIETFGRILGELFSLDPIDNPRNDKNFPNIRALVADEYTDDLYTNKKSNTLFSLDFQCECLAKSVSIYAR